jgi:hypothetical protein
MKRLILAFALLASLGTAVWADGPMGGAPQGVQNNPPPTSAAARRAQRWRAGSYGTWVRTMAPGYPAYRYTYSGQKDDFPLPAIFQSGSEHTNYTWGKGF